uniref:Uncharacterized protein n=1 Tax=Arundo donax TaxID=35708 RepID=A0A0A9CCX9_ARUDO
MLGISFFVDNRSIQLQRDWSSIGMLFFKLCMLMKQQKKH